MKRYKKLIVPIDLGDADSGALLWASKVSHLAESEEVLFVHSVAVPEIPEQAKAKHPWLLEALLQD